MTLNIRIASLCLAMVLLLCSCGEEPPAANHTTTTTTGADITTSTTNNSVTDDATTTDTSTSATANDISRSETMSATTTTTSRITTTEQTSIHSTTSTTILNTVTFKATIRDNVHRQPVSGVTVTLYVNGNSAAVGSAVTDQNGMVHIPTQKGNSYRVVLSALPDGYEANPDYRFSGNTVNITIRKSATQNESDHSEAQYDVGKTMTNFTLTDTDGNTYRLSDALKEKKLIILDFWFTTCEPCKREFPYFESAMQHYGDDVLLLAINPIDSLQAITDLRERMGVTFPMMQDTCNLYRGFGVVSYPTTVFIDADGRILDIHIGTFPSEAAFFSAIDSYLP